MSKRILFYGGRGPRGFLSNFHETRPITVEIDDEMITARTSEALYQAAKFPAGSAQRRAVLAAPTPARAKALGSRHGARADWDDVRVDVMRTVLRAKFADPALRALLLATGDAQLVEDSPRDAFWGAGAGGAGKNMLGKLLMALRAQLARPIAPDVDAPGASTSSPSQ